MSEDRTDFAAVLTKDGAVEAFSVGGGQSLWRVVGTPVPEGARTRLHPYLLVARQSEYHLTRAIDGRALWSISEREYGHLNGFFVCSNTIVADCTVDSRRVYVALDLNSGAERWRIHLPADSVDARLTSCVHLADSLVLATPSSVQGVSLRSGRALWERGTISPCIRLLVFDDDLAAVVLPKEVIYLVAASGEVNRSEPIAGKIQDWGEPGQRFGVLRSSLGRETFSLVAVERAGLVQIDLPGDLGFHVLCNDVSSCYIALPSCNHGMVWSVDLRHRNLQWATPITDVSEHVPIGICSTESLVVFASGTYCHGQESVVLVAVEKATGLPSSRLSIPLGTIVGLASLLPISDAIPCARPALLATGKSVLLYLRGRIWGFREK
ncbi:MAG: PQQ-binding-like beta-propeller repeat protein [Candidatus Hydrogenedentes bacterium]|nr:PQQ-binding-like beta-propeller repeat protein [Candidatus Hydrogenedentota bacterium]